MRYFCSWSEVFQSMRHCILFGFILVLAGCAEKTGLPSRILFPPPPEEARFEYIGVYYNADDLKTSRLATLAKGFLGATEADQFVFPTGVAVDQKNRLFVSDSMDANIKIVDFEKKTIDYMFKKSNLVRPIGIAFDREGFLFVADPGAKAVRVYPPSSISAVMSLELPEMEAPAYVAINDQLNRVYVSDAKAHRVFVFDKTGKFLFRFGEGSSLGVDALFGPQGMAIAADGTVYIAEIFRSRISVFDADGAYLRSFGERGDTIWTFDHPKSIAFDSEGHLYITDARRGKIVVYSREGELLMVLGSGSASLDPLQFAFPAGITISSNDRLFVADAFAKRISVWQYVNDAYKEKRPITAAEIKEIEAYLQEIAKRDAEKLQ